MKVEMGRTFPANFKALYPEEFELFSHFEVTAAIPTVLFAITTWKENGKPQCVLSRLELFFTGIRPRFLL